MNKKTKIVATVGPACEREEIISQMIVNGVNVFRLNFSHGTHEYHYNNLTTIRRVSSALKIRVGILQDISGPKIRVLKLPNPFLLKKDHLLDFYKDEVEARDINGEHFQVSINYSEVLSMLKVGDSIFLCDGSIKVVVEEVNIDFVRTRVENEGVLNSNKGINFPHTKINIDVITQKDKLDLKWGMENNVDFLAVSFVQNAHDIKDVREILAKEGAKIDIFAKIEKFDAVENIDEILAASDGIMVARGDLGIEVPYFMVPSIQKNIIKKANEACKPVITATQMLLSLTHNKSATRAEISDVANAVLDGTDAVMLSEESAVGIDPANSVAVMSATIMETEKNYPYNKFSFSYFDEIDIITQSAARLAHDINVDKILCLTSSGNSALKLGRYRSNITTLAISHDDKIQQQLTIAWGIDSSFSVPKSEDLQVLIRDTIKMCALKNQINLNETYLLIAGFPAGTQGSTNLIRVIKKDQIEFYLNS